MYRFVRYELRTTDVDAAEAFYEEVLGRSSAEISIVPLPERLAARGVPSNWLSTIGVADVQGTADRMIALGGEQLGPLAATTVLRDPAGAIVGLSADDVAPRRPSSVAWHVLHTHDHERGLAAYAELFGWTLGTSHEGAREFAWDPSGVSAGCALSTVRTSGAHPHWMVCFAVDDLDVAAVRARELGAKLLGTRRLPNGAAFVPGDDPQGAAFGLYAAG